MTGTTERNEPPEALRAVAHGDGDAVPAPPARGAATPEALLIGGRSGVGKTTVAFELSAKLARLGVAHCHVEGDTVAHVEPAPPGDPLRASITEANLTAMWGNVAALGYTRLVYTNTVAPLGDGAWFIRALGGRARLIRVLLTATDASVRDRLAAREIGDGLAWHLRRSSDMAPVLDGGVPPGTVRVATDGRTVGEIADEVIAATGWRPAGESHG